MSQDGVIRSSSFIPDAPAESTFTNRGGVLRAQIGSDVDARALQRDAAAQRQIDEAQPKWGSNARNDGGLVRTTIIEGVATETTTPTVTSGNTADLRGTDPVNAGVISTARSPSGRALAGHEITATSVVMLPEGIETTAQNAARMGYIRVNPASGLYENGGGNAGATQGPPQTELEKDRAELQRHIDAKREAEEKAATTEVPVAEPFDNATEALLSETIAGLGNQSAQAAVHSIINTGELSEGLTAAIAGQLGIEGAQATERATQIMGAFKAQADAAVGVDSAEAIWAWARDNRASALKEAMVRHANEGTTGRYAAIAQDYFASLADTEEGRADILASKDATAWQIFAEPRSGKLFITHPKAGRLEWKVAVREGLIKPNRNRS